MAKILRASRVHFGILAVGLLGMSACAAPDYSDGINSFSKAITTAANLGQPLATAAQQAAQNQTTRNLANIDPTTVSLADACKADTPNYHPGDCALLVSGAKMNYAGTLPDMSSLTKYAAALSSVVADQTCVSLQADAKNLAAAASDVATKAGSTAAAAAAGPISQIAAEVGCASIGEEQLKILKTATAAADPSIQLVVPLIANAYNAFYMDALNEAHGQAMSNLRDYETAVADYQKTKSQADLTKEQSSLSQVASFAAAIDKAKSTPPGPVVLQIATLHKNLTNDLQSPTVTLERVLDDAQTFVTEAASVTAAAEALAKVNGPAAKSTPAN